MFSVNFFSEDNGNKPVAEFISALAPKMRAKVVSDLHRLEMLGFEARYPLSRHLGLGIFELRTILGHDIVRVLYFFDKNEIIMATNGFVKKQMKTPRSEILLAVKRREKYFEKRGRE